MHGWFIWGVASLPFERRYIWGVASLPMGKSQGLHVFSVAVCKIQASAKLSTYTICAER